jgi:hypothetical protein
MFVAANEAYIDWWLLQRFPSKTLEELDNLDWPRLQRAMEVDRIVEAEQRRLLYLDDKVATDAVTASEWQMWAHHDRLLGEE